MAYLNIDLDFPEHRKTKRLVSTLGRGTEALLLRIWCYLGKYQPECGRLIGLSPDEIETIAGWRGKAGAMVGAMLQCGWLERGEDGTYQARNWLDHQGHIAAFQRKGREMAAKRWAGHAPRTLGSNAASNAVSNALPNQPTNQPTDYGSAMLPASTPTTPKRLHRLPATLEEVIEAGRKRRDPKDEATCRRFWNHYEGQAKSNENGEIFWITSGGTIVTNWLLKLDDWRPESSSQNAQSASQMTDKEILKHATGG